MEDNYLLMFNTTLPLNLTFPQHFVKLGGTFDIQRFETEYTHVWRARLSQLSVVYTPVHAL